MTEAWASPADAVIPLAVTGTVVDSPQYANVADIMRLTLSNIEAGSIKLW